MALRWPPYSRFLSVLGGLLAVQFVGLGIDPVSRSTWLLENVLTVALVLGLAGTYRRFRFSRASYLLIFLFLAFHQVGAHYTYSEVPYDAWMHAAFGVTASDAFGWERNHFDRLAHLAYGLLFAYPIRELFLRVVGVGGVWGYVLPLTLTMSTSMIYELIEWGAAVVFGGDLGQRYLGTQGDEWDAHWDMALATLGATLSMAITAGVNASLRRDFAAELAESLRVKRPEPLGEHALDRMLEDRRKREPTAD